MDNAFEINGRQFQMSKINVFKQFHIVRRIGPILADMLPAMKNAASLAKKDSALSESDKLEQIANFVGPIMTGLSKLSDEDANLVLFGLLSSIEVKQMPVGNWAKVSTDSMLMIQDIELPLMLQLAGRAFMFNLSGFFAALPQQS